MQIRAKKSLGQNFLTDQSALSDIAAAIDIRGKHIIEVGPGYGALTEHLIAQSPETLDLVELDQDMIDILLERKEKEWNNMTLSIQKQDILTYISPYDDYAVIANIPYYITSPILFHFLYPPTPMGGGDVEQSKTEGVSRSKVSPPTPPHRGAFESPEEMVIMMQEEVGEKILEGRAKKPHHSYLSLAMELACEDIEIIRYVSREAFDPAPKVDSIVLRFIVEKDRNREKEEELLALWRVAFTHPRKTLLSNLKGSRYDIDRIRKTLIERGYDERVRAEAVKKEDWETLI